MGVKERYEQRQKEGAKTTYSGVKDRYMAREIGNIASLISNRVDSWIKTHNGYVSDYQKRYQGRKGTYEDSYVSDSADWLNTVSQQKSNLDAEADSIISYMSQYKDYLDLGTINRISDTLAEARKQQRAILDGATRDNEWWNSFGNEELVKRFGSAEEAYKANQRYNGYSQKYNGYKYEDVQKAFATLEDGEEKDWLTHNQYDLYKNDSTYNSKAASGWKSYEAQKIAEQEAKREEEANKTWGDKAADFIIDNFGHGNTDNPMLDFIIDQQELYRNDTSYREPNDEWSAEQKNRFGYLWTESPAKAYQYAEQVNNQINDVKKQAQQQDVGNWAAQNFGTGTLGTLGAIATAPTGLADLMDDFIEYSARGTITQKGYITPFEFGQAAQSGVANKLNGVDENGVAQNVLSDKWGIFGGKGWGDIYSLGVSTANSMLSALTLGGTGTLVNFIGQGGASGVDDALSRGATAEQALLYGTAVGALEGLTEFIPAENLIKVGSSATLKNWMKQSLKQGVGEFFEEGASSFFGNLADDWIMKDKSNFNIMVKELMDKDPNMTKEEAADIAFKQMARDVAFDAVGGFASGAVSGGLTGGYRTMMDARKGNQKNIDAIKQHGDNTDALIQEGLQNDVKSDSYKLATKYQQQVHGKDGKGGKAMTGFQIRNLLAANQAEVTKADLEKIQDAAANRLAQVGQREDIYKIAELATKYATGQEMTRAERSTLANNKYGAQVTSELLRGNHPDNLLSKWENDMSDESGAEYSTEWTGDIGTESDQFLRYNSKKLTRTILERMANMSADGPDAYKSLESRMESEEPAQVSDTGKAVIRATGEEIDLTSPTFKKITKDGVVLDVNGKTVRANEIDYDTGDQGLAINGISKIEHITPAAATALYAKLDMTKSVMKQLNGMDEAFTYGFYNYPEADLEAGNFAGNLTQDQKTDAYKLGQYVRGKSDVDNDAPIVKMRTAADAKLTAEQKTAQQKARFKGDAEVYFMDGSNVVKFDESGVQLDESNERDQRILAGVNTAKFLSKLGIGGKYYFYQSHLKGNTRYYKDANGVEKPAPNGFYTAEDGSIYIDLNAGDEGEGTALFTLGHELTHFVKAQSKKQFKILADLVKEAFDKTDMSMHKRVLAKQKFLENARNGEAVSYDEAYEEVVADAMSTMLTDGSLHEKLMEIKVKDKGLFNTIKRFFEKMIAKFREVYAELTPDQRDARDIREMKDMFDKIQTAFAEALVEASENFRAAMESVVETKAEPVGTDEIIMEGAVVTDGEGERFSIRSMKHDIADGKMFEDLKKVCNWTDAQVETLRHQLTDLVDYMIPYRNKLDMNETYGREGRRFSPYKPNSDPLYKISMDFSTLCSKRLLTQYVIEQLQLREKRPMSAEEQMAIRDMLNEYRKVEKGLQVACAMCYVEAARLKSPKQIQRWLDDPTPHLINYFAQKNSEFNATVKKAQADFKESKGYDRNAPKKDMKPADVKKLNEIGPKMRSQYQPSVAEQAIIDKAKTIPNETYLTAGNLADLSEKESVIYDAYTSFVRTATRSKSLESDEPYYYGDSMRDNGNGIIVTDSFIEAVNRENGMRFSSWSDWRIQHLLDYITAVIDNSVRGAAMHGYTKFGDEVRVLGKTGMMFNMSGVAGTQTGLNEDGSLSFSPTESIDVNEAIQLRDEFPDTAGLQCIGVSNEHIVALLRSDIIDYVIPYHVSGLNKALRTMAKIQGWDDYTGTQNASIDKSIKLENAVDKDHWHEEPVFSEFFVGYDTKMSGIEAMRASAEKYKQMCKDRGLTPKFNQFAAEDNYWKLLIDRKMINQQTGKLIRQRAVTPTFDFGTIKGVVDKFVDNYDAGLEARALNHIVENWDSIPQRIKDLKKQGGTKAKKAAATLANQTVAAQQKDGTKKSDRSSTGDQLTKEQQEFFKDSKVRDENGNLKVMYHGTANGGYTIFDTYGSNYGLFGAGSYFTDSKSIAEKYTDKFNKRGNDNKQVYETYLNIKNPMDMDAEANPAEWEKAFPDADFPESGTNEDFFRAMEEYYEDQWMEKWEVADEVSDALKFMGYDGITHIGGGRVNPDGEKHRVYIAFDPEQIKNTDNVNPTENPDIRYSERTSNKDLAAMDDTALYIKNTAKADYIGMIFNGAKTEETRSGRTLDAFIGKDFYVTDGKYVYGSIVLGEPHKYTEEEFHKKKNQLKHRVPKGDKYDIKPGGTKWAYPIESYKKFDKPKKLSDSKEYKNSFQARQVRYSDRDGSTMSDRAREILANAKPKMIGKNEKASVELDTVRELFNELNSDKDIQALADRVFEVAKEDVYGHYGYASYYGQPKSHLRLPMEFVGKDGIPNGVHGQFRKNTIWGDIIFSYEYFMDEDVTPQSKASTILHEVIHAVTCSYIENAYNWSKAKQGQWADPIDLTDFNGVDERIKAGIELIDVFEQVKSAPTKSGKNLYGQLTAYEMVAEMANVEFRNFLKKQNLWNRIVDAIKRIFGVPRTTAYDAVSDALERILASTTNDADAWRAKSESATRYSDRDSDGKQLTAEQQEFFKNSMVRDADGNLLPVYHSTSEEFTTFEVSNKSIYGEFYYFAVSKTWSKKFHQEERYSDPKHIKKCYLNLTNVFDLRVEPNYTAYGSGGFYGNEWIKHIQDKGINLDNRFIEMWSTPQKNKHIAFGGVPAWALIRYDGFTGLRESLIAAGYDGIVYYDKGRGRVDNTVYVAFHQNQIKLASNKKPTTDPDTRYSERGEGTSNRHLLANAFEGISKSSIEYSMIQEYKGHIEELNKLDEKLSDINQKINKMLFDKETPRDSKKLKELQDEAKEVAKEINRYDKRLLNMEASEPLRKVIERERKKEAQKTKEHVKEIQQNKKDRAEQAEYRHKIRKTIRELDKLLKRGNKQRNVKEDMKGFVSKALELADYLFTDHVSNDDLIRNGITVRMTPKEAALVKETEDILSKLYDHAESLTDEEFTRLDTKRKANEDKLRDLLTAQRNERLNTPVYKLFNDLVTEYASLQNSNQDAVRAAYNSEVERLLRSFAGDEDGKADTDRKKALENMRVADMTTEELWKLYNAYTMVLTTVRDANKLHVKGKLVSIDNVVADITRDFSKRKIPDKKVAIIARNIANKLGWDYEKLYYALDRIGSEAFTELVMNIANSENIVMQDIMEAAAFRDEIVKKYGFNSWDVNKEIDREFLDTTGKKFKLTLGELMSLYAYSRREGAWDHIEYGGFVFGEAALTNPRPADSYKLTQEQCEAITNTLTKEQKGYVEDMQKFLSETMGEKGNEVSMLLYGIKMFGEKNYFPIHIAGQFKAQANESQAKAAAGFSSMSNAGFTHAQNPKAKAPFVLEGFNDIWADHVNEMSRYHGTVPALEDMRRVMNRSSYSESTAESMAIKQLMENSFGKEAVDYFDNLYREANSGAITDKLQKDSKWLLSKFRKNSVAYSLSVLIQQPASLVRAYAMIDKKYFGFKGFGTITSGVAKAVSDKWTKAHTNAYNEMLKYAPGVTMAKEIGGFDTATGGSIRSYLLDTNKSIKQKWQTENAVGKGKAVMDLVDNNAIANLPNVADKIAWIEIWNACKRETVAKHKDLATNSEEFMQAVGERFTEVIRATQVYDSIFAKSPMLKSKNLAVQYLVSFMNEPNVIANMAESAVRDATRGNWKSGVRTAAVLIHSVIFTNLLKSIVYAMRDDDEDETYIEKYLEAVTGNMMDDFIALNYIPLARDVWSLAQGYDVERADMAIVADAIDALNRVIKNGLTETEGMTEDELIEFDKKCTEANWKLVESLASFFGIPVKNIRREIEGVIDHARIASANAGKTTAQSAWDKVYDAVIESIPFIQTKRDKQDKLYDAIISGDLEYLSRLKSTYKDDTAYNNAVIKALREKDPRIHEAAQAGINGNSEERNRIYREIKAELGAEYANYIIQAINNESNDIRNDAKPDKVKGQYGVHDFVEAVSADDAETAKAVRDDIIQTYVDNGKTPEEAEKSFVSDVKDGIEEAYSYGELSKAVAENMLIEYADMEEEDAASKVNYWAFCEAHPQYELTESNVTDYQEFAEPAEIPLDVFVQYVNGTKGLASKYDEWGDVEVTKREQVLEVIDSLPLTWQQKDALYLAAGYSEDKIWDVPW